MSTLINLSINLDKIDKSKIITGQKGKYLNLTVSVNDETNQYGQNVSVSHGQTKEEREAKNDKVYLGNGQVVWTDGSVKTADKTDSPSPSTEVAPGDDDLPF